MFNFLPKGPGASRWAVSYFFAICGLVYGTVMSRVPALKSQAGLDEAQLGYALLCLGLGALTAFPLTGVIQAKTGSRSIQIAGGLILLLVFPLIGLGSSLFSMCAAFYLMGMGTGTTEIAMGIQGVLLEKEAKRPLMSSLHAMYSAGGLLGSLGGYALAGLRPLTHFWIIAGTLLLLWPLASSRLLEDAPQPQKEKKPFKMPPALVFVLGFLAFCSYATEGSVGDWGALYLHTVKGLPENSAALAYAAFCCTMVIARLFGDKLRARFGDYPLFQAMTILAAIGMLVVLYAAHPALNLGGYALMGVGLSVVVPIIFSVVGKMPGVEPGTGVTIITTMGYGGLLIAPPLIGVLARAVTLAKALHLILVLCLILVVGSRLLRRKA